MKTLTILTSLSLILIMAIPKEASSQNYRTGVGFRAGYPFGLTVKHFFSPSSSIEGIAGGRSRGFEGVVLYEYTVYPARRKEFDLYFGGGGHLGVFSHHHGNPFFEDHAGDPDPFASIGIDGIVGFSWTFDNAPVNLGFDYKPAVTFYRYVGYFYGDFAFSVRYAFGSDSDRANTNSNR